MKKRVLTVFNVIVLAMVLIITSTAHANSWSDWETPSDNHRNGIDFSWKLGTFKYDNGQVQINYRFRNRYQHRVSIHYRIVYSTNTGDKIDDGYTDIGPDQVNSNGGFYDIGYRIDSISVGINAVDGKPVGN